MQSSTVRCKHATAGGVHSPRTVASVTRHRRQVKAVKRRGGSGAPLLRLSFLVKNFRCSANFSVP